MIDFNQDPAALMTVLEESKKLINPKIPDYIAQYNPETHGIIADKAKYPDKIIETPEGTSTQPVNRLALAVQKMIVDKSVAFGFGRPVTYLWTDKEAGQAVEKIFKQNKLNSLTRKIARDCYTTSHTAELWYQVPLNPEDETTEDKVKFRIRCVHLNASKGDVFYPVFDNGDMVAFVREITKKDLEGKEKDYAEIYTAENTRTLINDGGWQESADFPTKPNPIKKIPVIYASQDAAEWFDVQRLIDRLEGLISGHAEVNDYHFAPKLKAVGEIKGFSKKGEKGAVFEMANGSSLDYLTWNQGTESLALEFKQLWDAIFKITQTPDISFENMKGFGAVSGVAWQYFFMDAHLKVEMKREIWDDYLIRRVNIVKAFIGKLLDVSQAEKMKELDAEIQINPYIINDLATKIGYLTNATGGKAVISQETAVKDLDLTEDSEAELRAIQNDQKLNTEKPLQETI